MLIKYYKKNVYGDEKIYLHDKKVAESVARLTRRKTVTINDLAGLIELGHGTEEVPPPENV